MSIPFLPESAPFSSAQRAGPNGFFAGAFGLAHGSTNGQSNGNGHAPAATPLPAAAEEDFPWHDAAILMDERLKLAEGKPHERVLMAAMAQLDCGACGYLCKTYAEAIARGEEPDLGKCSPGGKETAKKLKELVVGRKALPIVKTNGHAGHNGIAANGVAAKPSSDGIAANKHDRKNPFHAPLLKCEKLTAAASDKDVRFVAFTLKGSGLTYEVGDALGVFPENCPELVEMILAALGAPRGRDGADARRRPRPRLRGPDPALRGHQDRREVRRPTGRVRVRPFGGVHPPYASRQRPRRHSRSLGRLRPARTVPVGPGRDPGHDHGPVAPSAAAVLHLVVAQGPSGGSPPDGRRRAVCEGRPGAEGSGVELPDRDAADPPESRRVRPRVARLPSARIGRHARRDGRTGDRDRPLPRVPGRARGDRSQGKNWLFFGDQRRDTDFLYRDEMEDYSKSGVLTRLDTAFSRDQSQKVYVQHRMKDNAKELWAYLEAGAHFYVCGDARRMALDVDHALHAIVAEQGGMTAEKAKDYVKAMSKSKRYQRDVY